MVMDFSRDSIPFKLLLFVSLFLFVAYVLSIFPILLRQNYNDDLYWYVPIALKSISGHSFQEIIRFVFSFRSEWGVPSLNAYSVLLLTVLGNDAGYHSIAGLVVFALNCFLFAFAAKYVFRFSLLLSVLCGLLFFASYPHFHSYTWGMAIQHQLVLAGIFFLLIIFIFIEDRRKCDPSFSKKNIVYLFLLIFVFSLASFLRTPILFAAIFIFLILFFRSDNLRTLLTGFAFWAFPISFLFLFFLIDLSHNSWGWQVTQFIQMLVPSSLELTESLPMSALFVLGLFSILTLLFYKVFIEVSRRNRGWNPAIAPITKTLVSLALIIAFVVAVFLHYPMNFARFNSYLQAFWFPWDAVLSTVTYGRWQMLEVNTRMSGLGFLLIALFSISLFNLVVKKKYEALTLLIPVIFMLEYIDLFVKNSPWLVNVGGYPSRYTVYFSPIAVCSSVLFLHALFLTLTQPLSRKYSDAFRERVSEILLVVFVGVVCLLNISAIQHRLTITFLSEATGGVHTIFNLKLGDSLRQYILSEANIPEVVYVHKGRINYEYHLWFAPGIFKNSAGYHPVDVGVQSEIAPRRVGGARVSVQLTSDVNKADVFQCDNFWCDRRRDPIDKLDRVVKEAAEAISEGAYGGLSELSERLVESEPFFIRALTNGKAYGTFLDEASSDDWPQYLRKIGYDVRGPLSHGRDPGLGNSAARMIHHDIINKARALIFSCYIKTRNGEECGERILSDFRLLTANATWASEGLFDNIRNNDERSLLSDFFKEVKTNFSPTIPP